MKEDIGCAKFVKNFRTGEFRSTWAYFAGTFAVSGVAVASGEPGESFFGGYVADVSNSLGEKIHWQIKIMREKDNVALVEWRCPEQELFCRGLGLIEGDTMTVGWHEVCEEK